MVIRRERLRKENQGRIAISLFQIAQDLVIGPVLLDHVDHMPDALAKEGKKLLTLYIGDGIKEMVVARHLLGERLQLRGVRPGHNGESTLFKLQNILADRK